MSSLRSIDGPAQSKPALDLHNRLERLLIALIFIAANCALFATAPKSGDFWWSDAPRHALNGAFIKDLILAAPWHDLRHWAIDYYLKYPALTILFYPPLFYCFLAVAYFIFGVSQWAAQLTVSLFTALLGVAAYQIVRDRFPRWSALGASLMVIGGPETAFWARQIMLDVPAYAAFVTAAFFCIRYIDQQRARDLYFSVIATLVAVYIRYTSAVVIPVLVLALLISRGPCLLKQRHVISAAAIGGLGIIPAALLFSKFGAINIQSITGRPHDLSRASLDAWLFYAEAAPHYVGYAGMAAAICGIGFALRRRASPLESWFVWFLLAWLVLGYLTFSVIDDREMRLGLILGFPLVIFGILGVHSLLPERIAPAVAATLGLGTLIYSVLLYPPPAVKGYAAVANYVAKHAPKNAVVLFSGYRDGNFIFDMRTEKRRDISTIRADKLLLRVAVERERGVGEARLDERQIADTLRAYGVSLVVLQPHFWTDLREMARLSAVLHNDFKLIARFPITGAADRDENEIEVLKPTYPVVQSREKLKLDMPIIGETFRGTLN